MAHQTVFYHSLMAGMPAGDLRGNAGALTTMLDAVLVNGLNPTTVVGVTRSGNVATYTLSGTNNFAIHDVVEASGFDQAEYNGRMKVTGKTASTITATISGTPVSPGTGTAMSMRHPPAGWSRLALGTNQVAYRTAGTKDLWVQVEDNNPYSDTANSARVKTAQGLTALNAAAALGGEHKISKEDDSWAIVADPRTFYVVMRGINVFFAGEIESFVPGDAYPMFVTRGETGEANTFAGRVAVSGRYFPQWVYTPGMTSTYTTAGVAMLRSYTQTGGPVDAHCLETADLPYTGANSNMKRWQQIAAANPSDASAPLLPLYVMEYGAAWALRGQFRGLYWPLAVQSAGSFPSANNNTMRLDDVAIGGQVRSAVVMRFGINSESQIAFDLGDWA